MSDPVLHPRHFLGPLINRDGLLFLLAMRMRNMTKDHVSCEPMKDPPHRDVLGLALSPRVFPELPQSNTNSAEFCTLAS